jgi:hypothetical protein
MKKIVFVVALFVPTCLFSQQIADTLYNPEVPNPVYEYGEGPVIFIDEGHHNFHTKNGRYKAFSILLERDGYRVEEYKGGFVKEELVKGKIMVISNASPDENTSSNDPSAFTKSEIEAMRQWVFEGGRLFLIADHNPAAGAAIDLATVFGFEFTNGTALNMHNRGPGIFKKENKTLADCSITKGRNSDETVEQVTSFTGQAFKIPNDATSILTFNADFENFLADTAGVSNNNWIRYSVEGWSQGAYRKYGKGRVVAFGEAAMFTAQLGGPEKTKVGMNSDIASENYQLLLNIIHWLDGKFD